MGQKVMSIKKRKVLLSGFESFLDVKLNPTEQLMTQLQNLDFENLEVKTVVLPVEFVDAFKVLKTHIDDFKPDLVLSFGVANQRQNLEIERIAINFRSSKNKDNSGFRPSNDKIDDNGPDGVFSNLKIDEIVSQLKKEGIQIDVSNSAGAYVCNSLMYELCLDAKKDNYFAGFIHTPNSWPQEVLFDSAFKFITSAIKIHI